MKYTDLNVYQLAYIASVDLHMALNGIDNEQIDSLKENCREVLACLADGISQRTSKAKRYSNFKALDYTRRIIIDLEFMVDTGAEELSEFIERYKKVSSLLYKLNKSILNGETGENLIHPLLPKKKE